MLSDYINNTFANKKGKIKFNDLILSIVLLLFCFSDFLSIFFEYANYFDEFFSLILLFYFLFDIVYHKKQLDRFVIISIFILSLIVILGIIGNFVFAYQTNFFIISLDILATFKYLFIYIGARNLLSSHGSDLSNVKKIFNFFCTFYIVVLSFLAFANLLIDIGMSNEYRYGLKNFSFIFDIPGILINHCFICALTFFSKDRFKMKDVLKLLLCAFVMLSTLKTRGFILAAIVIIILFFKYFRINKINVPSIVAIVFIIVLIGFPQFENYFINNTGPRFLFIKNSISLANRFYLFGTGFSTFGSGTASQYYSPLYFELGFNLHYGMSPDSNLYLNDTFWPSILGQFGYIGFSLYFFLFSFFSYDLIKEHKKNVYVVVFLLLNAWFSSIQSAFITSTYFCSGLLLSMVLSKKREVA